MNEIQEELLSNILIPENQDAQEIFIETEFEITEQISKIFELDSDEKLLSKQFNWDEQIIKFNGTKKTIKIKPSSLTLFSDGTWRHVLPYHAKLYTSSRRGARIFTDVYFCDSNFLILDTDSVGTAFDCGHNKITRTGTYDRRLFNNIKRMKRGFSGPGAIKC